MSRLAEGLDGGPAGSVSVLSVRETEVLALAARGLHNAEIAARLKVSVHAVKFHLASIYRKLGVTNRTEAAVRFAHSAIDTTPAASGGET